MLWLKKCETNEIITHNSLKNILVTWVMRMSMLQTAVYSYIYV